MDMSGAASGATQGAPFDISKLPKDSRGSVIVGVASFCMAVGTIAVALRLYTRLFIVRRLGIDDGMAMLSLLFLIGLGIAQILTVGAGLGTHMYLLRLPGALVPFLRNFWFVLLFYNTALLFIKMTFLFQYYRVVAQVRRFRIGYVVFMFLIGGWTISQIFIVVFSCVPVHKFWDFSAKGTCSNNAAESDMNAIGNIVTDFVVLVLPLPVLLRLQLERPQKLALVAIFCLGFFTCIISIIRRIFLKFTPDLTYSAVDVTAWSIAEVASGILCAALPTLRPLFGRYFPSFSLSATFHKYSGHRKAQDSTFASTVESHRLGRNSVDHPFVKLPSKADFDIEAASGATEMGAPRNYWPRDHDDESDTDLGPSHKALPTVSIPKPVRIRGGLGEKKIIAGKTIQISWPVESSTSISGTAERRTRR